MDKTRKPNLTRRFLLFLAGLALPLAAWSHESGTPVAGSANFNQSEALNFSQSAIGRQISDYPFRDSDNRAVQLSNYLGKPVVVSFIYTSCHHTCPLTTKRLSAAVDVARGVFGADGFQVLSVGFDAEVDSPARMQVFAHQHRVGGPGWEFLSADRETIAAFTAELGFIFFPSPKGFDHLAQISIVDAQGRVYRQIYGDDFSPPAIVEPLKELVFNKRAGQSRLADWIDGIRLFCTVYDPASGKYRFDYSVIVTAITGIVCLGAVAIFLVHGWRQHRASDRSSL